MSSPGEVMRSDQTLRLSPSSEQLYAYDYYRHQHHPSMEPSSSSIADVSFAGNNYGYYDNISSSQQSQFYDNASTIDHSWTWSNVVHEDDQADHWAFLSGKSERAKFAIQPSATEASPDHSIDSHVLPSMTTDSQSPNSNFLTSQHSPHTSIELEREEKGEEEGEESEEEEEVPAGRPSAEAGKKKKIQRRQGVTCDQCRSKHVRCIARDHLTNGATQIEDKEQGKGKCERCYEKDLDCTRNYAPPSRRYPRPSRTGKRIEQARMIHGTLSDQTSTTSHGSTKLSPDMLIQARPRLFSASNPLADAPISSRIMAGSVSLRLLTCFFATAHMQMPIVDFHNFSARYNFAQGNCHTMSVMANGGDASKAIPSAKQSAPGLLSPFWPPEAKTKAARSSALSTPGSSEALIAVMHAWAALYTDIPIAFGGPNALLLSTDDSSLFSLEKMSTLHDRQESQAISSNDYVMGANGRLRRAKRKSGVACDTCRLRRLRCDKLERPEGLGCSRCQDKRIVCTDEYIQLKRRKEETASSNGKRKKRNESEADEMIDGLVGSAPSVAKDVVDRRTDLDSIQQKSWLDQGLRVPSPYHFGKSKEALAFGKARQPFFHALLEKAINLAVKHQLLLQPSVEGIQVLMLLAQIVDLAKHRKGDIFADAAANHIASLGLESNYEVDETDRKAVEQILGHMQRRRLWCCVWTRDAIVSGLYRKSPQFLAERAFSIRGSRNATVSTQTSSPPEESAFNQVSPPLPLRSSQNKDDSDTFVKEKTNHADLNGEMGLSFSILALMQVGALSRFMAKYVDNATLSLEYGTLDPTSVYEMRKLTKACQALWKSIDSLLSFFDQCSLTARQNMDRLQPFQPLGWIATIKIAGAMLDLATFRNLAERLQRANLVFSSLEQQQQQRNQQHPLVELQTLMEESRKRTLNNCRRIAKLVGFLLDKNVFQTSGIILRQLLAVTQFLVKMPCEIVDPLPCQVSAAVISSLGSEGISHPVEMMQQEAIDPRRIFMDDKHKDTRGLTDAAPIQDHFRQGHIPDFIFSTVLEPFDDLQKKKEVEACLEALAQMGYAWPTMDVEIAYLERMMEQAHL